MKNFILASIILLCSSGHTVAQCFANGTAQSSSCGGLCNGSLFIVFNTTNYPIMLSINGGVPFQVTSAWQQGGLCPGVYNFQAIDNNGDTCSGSTTITIPQLSSPVASVNVVNSTCAGCNDGAATVSVTGGSSPYTYLWSNGSTGQSVNNLSPGNYTVTVTDVNGCTDIVSFVIGIGVNGVYAVGGEVYLDLNSNGVKDSGEQGIANQIVNIQPLGINAYTSSNGSYLAIVPPGVYDVTYQNQAGWILSSSPATYNATITTSSISGLDFGLYPDSTSAAVILNTYSNIPRCLWNVNYYVNAYNNGYTILDGTLTFTYDPSQIYVGSSIMPASVVGNTLTYTFTNLAPGQSLNPVITLTEPAAGTPLSLTTVFDATDVFSNALNDTTILNQTVTCSYDPNDKSVSPPGIGSANYVNMEEWLNYQIRFQNTGTDTAFKVVIVDTLDSNLDINTFTLSGNSHPVFTSIDANRQIQFIFENIFLPDSNVNEPASHGYVAYRIKGLNTNPDPTPVSNTAYIYFDQNSAVQTNTTLTTFSDNFLGIPDQGTESGFVIFPNPMNQTAVLRVKKTAGLIYAVSFFDLSGRKVAGPFEVGDNGLLIHKNDLQAGVYLVEANPRDGGKPEFVRLVIY